MKNISKRMMNMAKSLMKSVINRNEERKAEGFKQWNLKKHNVRFGILQKLILGFLVPIAFIVVLGIISYSKASEGLVSNYQCLVKAIHK